MNNNIMRDGSPKDKWVCCPDCGTKNRKTIVGNETCRCVKCGTDFKAWVVRGFVTVFPVSEGDDEIKAYRRFKDYHDQLMSLAD